MGKFITLREEFESETGAHPFADQQYIEWLEKVVEKQREVKNCSIPDVGLTLPLPDDNSMRQIAQHVRNSEESRDPLIYEQGIIRGMQIMKNIVSGN